MSYVRLERPQEHIGLITLDRPERYNALSFQLLRDFHAVLDTLDTDPTIRVAVVTGAGKGFCAGADLQAAVTGENGHWEADLGRIQEMYRMQQGYGGLVLHMRQAPQPLIAAVNGAAAGGGLSVALACDLRICVPSAKFNCAFTRLGLGGAEMGSSFFLPKLVGSAMAAELMYTGRFVQADEALQLGLVSRVVEPDALLDHALGLAREMVERASPFGLRITKEAINLAQGGLSLNEVIHVENRNQVLALQTQDFTTAATAWKDPGPVQYTDH